MNPRSHKNNVYMTNSVIAKANKDVQMEGTQALAGNKTRKKWTLNPIDM